MGTKYKIPYNTLTLGSLFAGIGGFDLSFRNVGYQVKWANEIDKKACITYRANNQSKIICSDIKGVDPKGLEKVDIITAGFPCQAFSIAGDQKGFQDDRGSVFFEILRFIKSLAPQVLLLENVKNILKHDRGKTFQLIKQSIEKLGYYIKYKVLNTCDYSNTPQNRERIYIVCFKDKLFYDSFDFPKKQDRQSLITISNLLESDVSGCFYYTHSKYYPMLKEKGD